MKRPRIRVECVVHSTPNGKILFGRIEWLTRKLREGTLTKEEQDELADLLAKSKKRLNSSEKTPKSVVISLGGDWKVKIPFKEYTKTYFTFKVLEKIW